MPSRLGRHDKAIATANQFDNVDACVGIEVEEGSWDDRVCKRKIDDETCRHLMSLDSVRRSKGFGADRAIAAPRP
jgi:hypothetical protein